MQKLKATCRIVAYINKQCAQYSIVCDIMILALTKDPL